MHIAYHKLLYYYNKFIIYSYRIEHAKINILKNINLRNKNSILMGITRAVNMHQQAMKLVSIR